MASDIESDDTIPDSGSEPAPDPVPDLSGVHLLEGEEVHHDLRAS